MDPARIEAAITPQTTAILAVHCYGRPCDVDAIERIADTYNLKVIYDAAHAFGVKCHCGSVLTHGDLSVLSFHATKVFTTFEGGAIVCPDAKTKQRIDYLKNFGFADEVTVVAPGINGKMAEINAALGLLQLKHVDVAIAARREVYLAYRRQLAGVTGVQFVGDQWIEGNNFSYFPILITDAHPIGREEVFRQMREAGVMVRRYFFPLIPELPMYRGMASAREELLPNAYKAAKQIICLPIFSELGANEIHLVCSKLIGMSRL
jgi:dTDP-4-amino-4,6-dideoxygalactose transaminase